MATEVRDDLAAIQSVVAKRVKQAGDKGLRQAATIIAIYLGDDCLCSSPGSIKLFVDGKLSVAYAFVMAFYSLVVKYEGEIFEGPKRAQEASQLDL